MWRKKKRECEEEKGWSNDKGRETSNIKKVNNKRVKVLDYLTKRIVLNTIDAIIKKHVTLIYHQDTVAHLWNAIHLDSLSFAIQY